MIVVGIFLLLFVDEMNKESPTVWKMMMISFCSGVIIIVGNLPGSLMIEVNPSYWGNGDEYTVAQAYYMYLLAGSVLFVPFLSYSYHILKTYKIAPIELRKAMKSGLFGIFFMLLSIPISLTGLSSAIPGSLKINLAVSFFFYSWMWYKEPQLVFILPFKAYRLIVIRSDSGLTVFTYDWDKNVVNEDLFSGFMMGISAFVKETLGKGSLKEINVDEAVLLIEKDDNANLIHIIVSSTSSQALRNGLSNFSSSFFERYHKIIDSPDITPFHTAKELVEKYFSFVPDIYSIN
jgi:hypothetical protein